MLLNAWSLYTAYYSFLDAIRCLPQASMTGGYDVVSTLKTTTFDLVNSDETPKYYAIIQTDAFLSMQMADGTWVSSLSSDTWTAIDSYCARFGVRRLSIFTYPTPQLGVEVMGNSSLKSAEVGEHEKQPFTVRLSSF